MARKLNLLTSRQLQHLLKLLTNIHQHLLSLLRASTLATRNISLASIGDRFSNRSGPDTDTVETFADIDDYAHYFSVAFFLERFTDCGEHDVEPELVDRDVALFAEGVRPFSSVLVLDVFPFGTDAFFEKVVVGFEG